MRQAIGSLCVFLLATATGCSQHVTGLEGTVLLDTQPFTQADVLFWPTDIQRECCLCRTDAAGTFQIAFTGDAFQRLDHGEYIVVVNKVVDSKGQVVQPKVVLDEKDLDDKQIERIMLGEVNIVDMLKGTEKPGTKNLAPPAYRTRQSPLRTTICTGQNELTVEMSSR